MIIVLETIQRNCWDLSFLSSRIRWSHCSLLCSASLTMHMQSHIAQLVKHDPNVRRVSVTQLAPVQSLVDSQTTNRISCAAHSLNRQPSPHEETKMRIPLQHEQLVSILTSEISIPSIGRVSSSFE